MTKEQFLAILDSVPAAERTSFVQNFRMKWTEIQAGEIAHALKALTEALLALVECAKACENSAEQCRNLIERVSLANDMITVMTDAWMVQWEKDLRMQFQPAAVPAQVF